MTLEIREFHTNFIAIKDVPNHDDYWKDYFVSAIDNELSHEDEVFMKTNLNRNFDGHEDEVWSLKKWKMDNNASTSYFNDHTSINYDDFTKKIIKPSVDEVINQLNFNQYSVKDIVYWYNRYDEMGIHGVHNHPGAHLCFIYILHLEEPNTTVFHNTRYTDPLYPKHIYTDDLPEGKLIFFPSHLDHEAQWSEKRRYTIAGNINLNYES